MRVVILGASGQLGREIVDTKPDSIELVGFGRKDFDIVSDPFDKISQVGPQAIINCAAYTNVDKAESEPEKAMAVNGKGVMRLHSYCAKNDIRMITYSTDYVFSGSFPHYIPTSQCTSPLNKYGESKVYGEEVLKTANYSNACVVRTSWLYSVKGSNFVKTIIKLLLENKELKVINDQWGSPTWAQNLALFSWTLLRDNSTGVFHYSDSGTASWYDFAVAIREKLIEIKTLHRRVRITPVSTESYKQVAKRPIFSCLDTSKSSKLFKQGLMHWQIALNKMIESYMAQDCQEQE